MTVKELYAEFCRQIPEDLREDWDNDGVMCCPDGSVEVMRALITLDVTEEIVDYAIESGFDLIVSHHPLIFKPLTSVDDENHVARKVIKLLSNGISVFSFHTRADKVAGGVNDILAETVGLKNVRPFGEGDLGRIGYLDEPMEIQDFAYRLKQLTGSDVIKYADAYSDAHKVALVGGDGKSYVRSAIAEGADTFVSGRIGYNVMEEAAEMGINLVEAGHYFTEQPVTEFFRDLLLDFDSTVYTEIVDSNMIKSIT